MALFSKEQQAKLNANYTFNRKIIMPVYCYNNALHNILEINQVEAIIVTMYSLGLSQEAMQRTNKQIIETMIIHFLTKNF